MQPGASITLSATVGHIEATVAYGDEVCKLDAALDCPAARHILEISQRPEITALLQLQLKAITTEQHINEVLVPIVVYLGGS